ncbi:MAG: HipA N-terminal domain-containing protein [Victivallales bacterium]|nr:HipA N-terminal domain-containing protein [Victivallales bacterium]
MRKRAAEVFFNGRHAGRIEEMADGKSMKYSFTYDREYLLEKGTCPVSLTMPKRKEPYLSSVLFPFFYGLLAEGRAKELQCRSLRIDESDQFGRLIATCGEDCIGAVTIRRGVSE